MKLIVLLKKRLIERSVKKKNWEKSFRRVGHLPKFEKREWLKKNLTSCVLKILNGYLEDRIYLKEAFGLTQCLSNPQKAQWIDKLLQSSEETGFRSLLLYRLAIQFPEPQRTDWLKKILAVKPL